MSYILTIVGARPQFVKAAVVSKALNATGIQEVLIHTGQHYDHNMSKIFWEELGIPVPNINLEIGSGLHGYQTGNMIIQIEKFVLSAEEKPLAFMVYGDTNSTLAGAIVASKLNIPIIHIEAGLRSFNREMPEEINRILTDTISELLFCSSDIGVNQLKTEGIENGVYNVGDVMYDALLEFSPIAESKFRLSDIIHLNADTFSLATIHRPSNTDNSKNLTSILHAFSQINEVIVWPVHPRNKKKLNEIEIPSNIQLIDPVSYFEMMVLLKNASIVLTDSGGLQKEAYWFKKKCITLRDDTEWVETLNGEWNSLTGATASKIIASYNRKPTSEWKPLYGDGNATLKIATVIKDFIKSFD